MVLGLDSATAWSQRCAPRGDRERPLIRGRTATVRAPGLEPAVVLHPEIADVPLSTRPGGLEIRFRRLHCEAPRPQVLTPAEPGKPRAGRGGPARSRDTRPGQRGAAPSLAGVSGQHGEARKLVGGARTPAEVTEGRFTDGD
jgi:hypothetical protein